MGTDTNTMTGSLSSAATLGASTRRTSDALYGALGAGSVKNVRRKISSTNYTINYYPNPDDSSKRQKVVVEEIQDTELSKEELKMAFRIFDKVGQGFIGVDRFREILREIDEKISDNELDEIIEYIDADHSGTIDFEEFVKIMT